MPIEIARWIVHLGLAYAAVGVVFAIPFAWIGAKRIDPAASDGTRGFKLLILPGAALLWPLLAKRWLGGTSEPPEERSPHRVAARGAGGGDA